MGTVQAKEDEEGMGSSTEEDSVDESIDSPSPNDAEPQEEQQALEDDQKAVSTNGASAATAASVVEGPLSKKEPLTIAEKLRQTDNIQFPSNNLFEASRSKKRSAFHEPQHRSHSTNTTISSNVVIPTPVHPNPIAKANHNTTNPVAESNEKNQELQPPDDGYKWRKYGRKMVKGNQFPRSYYKCVESNCPVRKYTEATQDETGAIHVKSFYSGEHKHSVAHLVTRVQAQDQTSFKNTVRTVPTELNANNTTSTNSTTSLTTKTSNTNGESNYTSRLVVETNDDVDFLDDGYNWRKYGQKNVKGTKSLRSYYKCTTAGCKMKKYVEKQGDKIVNVYEGQHNHPAPDSDSFSILPRKKRRRRSTYPIPALTNNDTDIIIPVPSLPTTATL